MLPMPPRSGFGFGATHSAFLALSASARYKRLHFLALVVAVRTQKRTQTSDRIFE
jgi:hypothetical protein